MRPPPARVLRAFGASGTPVLLDGGQGETWRCGDVVLKPAPEEAGVIADVMAGVVEDGFRVARPLASSEGGWVFDGWTAWTYVAGEACDTGRWDEEVAASDAFHRAVAHVPRPVFTGTSMYRRADRIAWGEEAYEPHPSFAAALRRAEALVRPVPEPCQLVHGDVGGNVLFADGLPPAVIDLAPHWRPVPYAAGVVVAGALVWYGADESVLDLAPWQYVVRGVLFRLAVRDAMAWKGDDRSDGLGPYVRAVELLERRAVA